MREGAKVIHTRREQLPAFEDGDGGVFRYTERPAVPPEAARHCAISFYELPPRCSNYPYHYHLDQEEAFYIVSGKGVLRTPEGETEVAAGDLLFFPAGEGGAHRLTNASDTEPLVYLDFDAIGPFDVAMYPDSAKVGIWGPTLNAVYRMKDRAHYYQDEG